MSKKCMPLWREAHLQVKKLQTPHVRSTFGSWDVEKCTPLWREAHLQVKKHEKATNTSEMSKKCAPLWREAHFEVKMWTTPHVRATIGRWDVVSRGRCKGLCTLSKVSKTWGFCTISKNDGRRGTFEEDLQRCIFRTRCTTRDMFIRAVRRSGRWFPERGYILEPQIFRFAEMILRDRCSTSLDLASLFRGRHNTLDRWTLKKWQNALVRGRQLCTQLSIFEGSLAEFFRFWCCQLRKMRKSRRIASFLTLSSSNIEEVSQNCFVFDVVKFKHWGSLGELLRFRCCQVQTMRKFRRIAPFLMLSSSKHEDVSQTSFVFKLADRKVAR